MPGTSRLPVQQRAVIVALLKRNWVLLVATTLVMSVSFLAAALVPWTIGEVIDGISAGKPASYSFKYLALALLMLIIAALGNITEPMAVILWLRATWAPIGSMARHIFPRRTRVNKEKSSGDVVTAFTVDADHLGEFLGFLPDAFASMLAFLIVAVLVVQISLPLGILVVVGMPVVMGVITLVIRPLQKRMQKQREEQGDLTSLASDAVVGLRVLRGIGGEDLYNERYRAQSAKVMKAGWRVARMRALLAVINNAGPSLFVAIVLGAGIYMSYTGAISTGELFTFYGYTSYLAIPISTLTQVIHTTTRAVVASKKVSGVLSADPLVYEGETTTSPFADAESIPWQRCALRDDVSGVVLYPGQLTGLVTEEPRLAEEIATRLVRFEDQGEATSGAHFAVLTEEEWATNRDVPGNVTALRGRTWVDLNAIALQQLREHVLFSSAIAEVFTGTLRSNLLGKDASIPPVKNVEEQVASVLGHGDGSSYVHADMDLSRDGELVAAMEKVCAMDVLDSVPGGLDGLVAERGRSLSGGQRQRLVLARAFVADPEVLVAVEPTSAVDSHTEAAIAHSLRENRRGKTTLVAVTSPLVLEECASVIFVESTGEIHRGTHSQLGKIPAYRRRVHRQEVE